MASIPRGKSLTGKLDAGEPPVQFGGRGGGIRHPYPYVGMPGTAENTGANSIRSIRGSGGSAVPCGTLDLLYQAPKAEALGYFQESLPGQAKGTERVIGL